MCHSISLAAERWEIAFEDLNRRCVALSSALAAVVGINCMGGCPCG